MSDEAAIDWFKRDNEALRVALAASQEREGKMKNAVTAAELFIRKNCHGQIGAEMCSALREALSTPSDAGRGGWQDISTAPKDGTIFIAGHGRTPPMIEDIHYSERVPGFPWSNGIGNFKADYFTHWMPRPQPPPLPTGDKEGGAA